MAFIEEIPIPRCTNPLTVPNAIGKEPQPCGMKMRRVTSEKDDNEFFWMCDNCDFLPDE